MTNTNQDNEKLIHVKKAKVAEIVNRLEWIYIDSWEHPVFIDPQTGIVLQR
ncbi:hypothetical protein [Commensalibacter nepenthis]|uniref:Uncharacterized protein n=1 Tax=Commensalibacter nepenthis TaxID=3043872 RepID=A0ABT6Q4A0_9PROT|nr:hypothetical protein [Commensalibacter sp. TBRC 10068]MDI2111725.1 hypothetical protein [Commensalibacter sp. TBRC 10068]